MRAIQRSVRIHQRTYTTRFIARRKCGILGERANVRDACLGLGWSVP